MAHKTLDCCMFATATTGTTDWAVGAAATGFQTPASAGVANGDTFYYRAESADLTQWEFGLGTYSTTGPTLARTTVIFSSAVANAKVNFTAAPRIFAVMPAELLASSTVFGLAKVDNSTVTAAAGVLSAAAVSASTVCFAASATVNQTMAASNTPEKVTLGSEAFDTGGNFATSRFTATVAGYYQIDAKFLADDTVAVASVIGYIYKNGVKYSTFIGSQTSGGGGGQTGICAEVIHLAATEYVELWGNASGTAPYFRFVDSALCCRLSGHLICKD